MSHPGFVPMLHMLSDNTSTIQAIEWMLHRPILAARVDADANSGNGALVLAFDGGTVSIFDDGQCCCESRYLTCDDDLGQFVGAEVVSAESRDGAETSVDGDPHETCFVHINTTRGTIVLCCHNEHNGCYGGFALSASLAVSP